VSLCLVSLRRNQEDPTNIVGDTRWDTRQDYDDYLAWRTDSGYTAQFEEPLAQLNPRLEMPPAGIEPAHAV
jgi:hypothetical protein